MAKEKKSVDEKLSEALEVQYETEQEVETSIVKKETNLPTIMQTFQRL